MIDLMDLAVRRQRFVNYHMGVELGMALSIDEMAILLPTEKALDAMLETWQPFNSVPEDKMVRLDTDHEEAFVVRFEFLKVSGVFGRIEAMTVLEGEAPLHAKALEETNGAPTLIHASFKTAWAGNELARRRTYDQAKRRLTVARDRIAGSDGPPSVTMAAEYRNSYGQFSYWKVDGIPDLYLKPRVNLRD